MASMRFGTLAEAANTAVLALRKNGPPSDARQFLELDLNVPSSLF
jgi:hypothetical protein